MFPLLLHELVVKDRFRLIRYGLRLTLVKGVVAKWLVFFLADTGGALGFLHRINLLLVF